MLEYNHKSSSLDNMASLVAQMVKHLPAMRETRVRSLGQEDPLEKEMATHSQYPCLENPMDGGALYATVHGVAKGQTQRSNFTFLFDNILKKMRHKGTFKHYHGCTSVSLNLMYEIPQTR